MNRAYLCPSYNFTERMVDYLAIKTASVTSLLLIWILINNLSDKKPHVHVALK